MALTPEAIAGAVSYYTNQQNAGNSALRNAAAQTGFAQPAAPAAADASKTVKAPAAQGNSWSKTVNDLTTKAGWLNPIGMILGTKWDGKNSFYDSQANDLAVDQGPSGAPKNATQWILNALSTPTYAAGRWQNELGHTTAMHAAEDAQKAKQPGGLNNPLDEARYWAENIIRPTAAAARGVAEGFGARFDGQKPITPGQNLETIGGTKAIKDAVKSAGGDQGQQNFAGGAAGFAADVLTDPTTYMGGIGLVKGLKSGVSAVGDAARGGARLDDALTAGIHSATSAALAPADIAKVTAAERAAATPITQAELFATEAAQRAAANDIPTTVDKIAAEAKTSGKELALMPKAAEAKVNPLADVPSVQPEAWDAAGKLVPKPKGETSIDLPSAKVPTGATLADKVIAEHPQMQAVRDLLPTLGTAGRTVDGAAILGGAKTAATAGLSPELSQTVTHVMRNAQTVPEITTGLKTLKATKEGKALLATPIEGLATPMTIGGALEKVAMRRVTGGMIADGTADPLLKPLTAALGKLGGGARTTPESLAASIAQQVPDLAPGTVDVPALMGNMARMNQSQREALLAQTLNIPAERFASFDDAIKAASNGQVEASAMRSMLKALGIKTPASKADTLQTLLSTRGTLKWEEIQKGIPTAQEVLDNHGIPADVQKAAVTIDVEAERAGVAAEVINEAASMSSLTKSLSELGIKEGMGAKILNSPTWVDGYGRKAYNAIFQPIVLRASQAANNVIDAATGEHLTGAIRAQFMYDHVLDAAEHVDKTLLAAGRVARFQTHKNYPALYVPVSTILRNLPEETVKAAVFNLDHRLTKFGEGYPVNANGFRKQSEAYGVGDTIYSTTIAKGAQAAHEGQGAMDILKTMQGDPFISAFQKSEAGNRVLIEMAANMAEPKFVAAMREAHTTNQMLAVANSQKAATDFVNPLASDIIAGVASGDDRGKLVIAVQTAAREVAKLGSDEASLTADMAAQRIHNGVVATLGEEGLALVKADTRAAAGRSESEILKTQAVTAKEAKLRRSVDGQRVPYSAHDLNSLATNKKVAEDLAALRADSESSIAADAQSLIEQGLYPDTAEAFILSRLDSEMGIGFGKAFTRIGAAWDGMFGQGSAAKSPGMVRIAMTAGTHRYAKIYEERLGQWLGGGRGTQSLAVRIQTALGSAAKPTADEITNHIRTMFTALQVHGADAARRGVTLSADELATSLENGFVKIPGVSDPAAALSPEFAQMAVELQSHIDEVTNSLSRLGANTADVMDSLSKWGLDKDYTLNPDRSLIDQGLNWHSWDASTMVNPMDTLQRTYRALMASSVKPGIASTVTTIFGHKGMDLSPAEALAKGWKYVDPSKSRGLGRYMDSTVLLPPEIIKQLGYVDRAITTLEKSFDTSPELASALKWYDRALNVQKQSMTSWNPSHWITNLLGDSGFNMIEGVDPRHSFRAMRAMHAGGQLDKNPALIDEAAHASGYADSAAAAANSPRFMADHVKVAVGGKQVQVSMRELYDHALRTGVDVTGHTSNDVMDHLGGLGKKDWYQKAAGAKYNPLRVVNKGIDIGSAARDNVPRYTQFIHELEKGKFRSLEEAVQTASGAVHRTHPTNGALAPMERTVARRLVTFYSWQRLALGRVVELALDRPGMVTIPSKFQFEQAQSAGFEPDSIGKPFGNDPRIATYSSNNIYGPTYSGGFSPLGGAGDLAAGEAPHQWGFSLSNPAMDALQSAFQGATMGTPQEMMKNLDQTVGSNLSPVITALPNYVMNHNPGGIGKPPQSDPGAYWLNKTGAPGRIVKALGLQPKTSASGKLVNSPEQQAGENARQAINYGTGLKFTDYTNDTSKTFAAKEAGKLKVTQWKDAGYTPEQIRLMRSASR